MDEEQEDDGQDISRYNLKLRSDLYKRVGEIAKSHGTSRLEVMRKFIKIGVHLHDEVNIGDAIVTVKTDDNRHKRDITSLFELL